MTHGELYREQRESERDIAVWKETMLKIKKKRSDIASIMWQSLHSTIIGSASLSIATCNTLPPEEAISKCFQILDKQYGELPMESIPQLEIRLIEKMPSNMSPVVFIKYRDDIYNVLCKTFKRKIDDEEKLKRIISLLGFLPKEYSSEVNRIYIKLDGASITMTEVEILLMTRYSTLLSSLAIEKLEEKQLNIFLSTGIFIQKPVPSSTSRNNSGKCNSCIFGQRDAVFGWMILELMVM
jgi:hypothetical protein